MRRGKKWYKSRTLWTAIALVIVQIMDSSELIIEQLEALGWSKEAIALARLYATMLLSIAVVILRLDTKEPIEK